MPGRGNTQWHANCIKPVTLIRRWGAAADAIPAVVLDAGNAVFKKALDIRPRHFIMLSGLHNGVQHTAATSAERKNASPPPLLGGSNRGD